MSDYRCVSDCRSRGPEFHPGLGPYFCAPLTGFLVAAHLISLKKKCSLDTPLTKELYVYYKVHLLIRPENPRNSIHDKPYNPIHTHYYNLHRQNNNGIKAPTATNTGNNIVLVSSPAYGSFTFGPEGRRDADCLDSLIFSSSSSSSSSWLVSIPGKGANFGTSEKQEFMFSTVPVN